MIHCLYFLKFSPINSIAILVLSSDRKKAMVLLIWFLWGCTRIASFIVYCKITGDRSPQSFSLSVGLFDDNLLKYLHEGCIHINTLLSSCAVWDLDTDIIT